MKPEANPFGNFRLSLRLKMALLRSIPVSKELYNSKRMIPRLYISLLKSIMPSLSCSGDA